MLYRRFAVKNTTGLWERALAVAASILYRMALVVVFIDGVASIPQWCLLFLLQLTIAQGIGLFFGLRKSSEIQLRIQKAQTSSGA